MNSILLDLSEKVDTTVVDAVAAVSTAADHVGVPFLIVVPFPHLVLLRLLLDRINSCQLAGMIRRGEILHWYSRYLCERGTPAGVSMYFDRVVEGVKTPG